MRLVLDAAASASGAASESSTRGSESAGGEQGGEKSGGSELHLEDWMGFVGFEVDDAVASERILEMLK